MKPVEITFTRAFKILWSFIWRGYLLMLPVMIVMMPLMFWLIPMPKKGESVPPTPPQFSGAKFFMIWLFMVGGMLFMQTLALRWAMKAKWSDFKLIAVPSDFEQHQ
jgi:hypothetical protein